ncbi:hypothetical protein [Tautonia rosea]|uniref:hypothetical protein n=1 Tax=Tautonia rosea TaxID=2728037 RepID=UPI001475E841|nr:hypothetical protein [Tautonia rosea]
MIAKRLLDSVALGLGLVGTLIALVLLVGVWFAAHRVSEAIERLAASTDRGVDQASELMVQVEDRIEAIEERVRAVPDQLPTLESTNTGSDEALAVSLARVAALEAAARELEAWASRTEQASDRLSDASSALGDLPFSLGRSNASIFGIADRLDMLSAELMDAVSELDNLHTALETIARATDLPEHARQSVERLSTTTSARLSSAADRVEATQDRFEEVRSGLIELSRRARTWVLGTALVLTALLAWLGIGQVSLFYLGWSSRNDRNPGARDTSSNITDDGD